MIWFLARRIGWIAITLWVVFTISFVLMRSMPGGPFDNERQLDPEILRNIERKYHLDESLPKQYWRRLTETLRFDLGPCYRMADYSVNEVIAQGLPVSASLGVLALAWAILLGVTAGVIAAVRRGKLLDSLVMTVATVGIAVPNFVVAGILLILFAFIWPILPVAGWGTPQQMILPAFCLGLPYAAYIARLVRTAMLDVLGQDFIRTARAKGLPPSKVVLRHALRGSLLPVVSFLGPAMAGIITGSLVIEQVFYLPGLGGYFIQTALTNDYTLAMGLVLLYTALLSTANLLVDVIYTVLDPRVELK
jgi:oligopeptide transport system permease protein